MAPDRLRTPAAVPMHRAVLLAATYHQLVMAQAIVRLVRSDYDDVVIVWFGSRPAAGLRHLLLDGTDDVRVVDCHGHRRLGGKVWRGGRSALGAALADYERAVGPRAARTTLFAGNDGDLFTQLVRRVSGVPWNDVVLFEEGIGFYVGTARRRIPERAVVNALLFARGVPLSLPLRDFSLNPRIRRLACNHPGLVRRRDVTVLDTAPAYVDVLAELAPRAGGPGGRQVESLYVSGNFSEAGHMTREEELRLLERVRAVAARVAGVERVHVKFHPLDGEGKRERMLKLGFEELPLDAPIELGCLRDQYRHVFSFRSSTVLNVSLLHMPDTKFWLFRGRTGEARALRRPSIDQLFGELVRRHENLGFVALD